MDKLGDMDLFVRVVRTGGLAAAGKEVGLSPARMTARIKGLEEHYGVRLLNRTTRSVTTTDEGRAFFADCERVLEEVRRAENRLTTGKETLAGPLRVTAPCDIGQQHVAPVLAKFVAAHPAVNPCLHLSDGLLNLTDTGFDIGVRYGVLPDSQLIARKLASSHRVLCASPEYLAKHGQPNIPADLTNHSCLAMIRADEPLTTWHFNTVKGTASVSIKPTRSSNDGALIRRWAIEGAGIALKSSIDVAADLEARRLVTVLDDYLQDFQQQGVTSGADLHVIYPNRNYLPERTRCFIDALAEHFLAVATKKTE